MKISGIYKIQSQIKPDRVYIGSAIDIKDRWWNHIGKLKNNKHGNAKLQNHFNKYGENDLIFIIIEPCFSQFLIIREQFYINTTNPYFNICKIAGSCLGRKHSEESKIKMSVWQKGKKLSEEHKSKLSESHKGKIPINKGKKMSPEQYEKCHKIMFKKGQVSPRKGCKLSIETKNKIRKARLGEKLSKETRRKISESNKGHIVTKETRLKISKANKGLKMKKVS